MTNEEKTTQIVEQGKKLNRRIAKLEADRDFLIDTMVDRPWVEMSAQARLLDEWQEEIEMLQLAVHDLRIEYFNLINNTKNKKEYDRLRKS